MCNSGTGSHHSEAFTFYPETDSFHCFACGANGDIFTLYGNLNGINERTKEGFMTIAKELHAKYNIYSAQPIRQKKQPLKPEPVRQETDYLTKRGLSLNTQRKFHCGYVSSYTYDHNTKATPAVIIPTSNTSYMWRSTIENVKQKRGSIHILNPESLKNEYCFVVEGEIDCLSIDECGFASIGLGSVSNIRKIFDFNTSKTVLIIALDNDKAGCKATVELSKLCDEYIIADSDIWGNCKDSNELLVKDKLKLVANLQEHSERALSLDKDQWLRDMLERKQANSDWRRSLIRNKSDNAVKNSLTNLETIFLNDPKFRKKIEFNELTQMRTLERKDWKDVTENRIKLYLEKEYSLYTSIDSINQVCSIIADDNSYHPIREYLNSVQWDGIHRVKSVFTDFLGATDNIYTQSVAIVTFVGAVARVFEPGVKFDTCTVFVGKQGIGKSKFISKIAVKPEWFTDGVTTFDGKDFYESIQGKWIIELGEG
ncbi:MAG: toprim domain-containing protein, partial [Ruminococcus sp.]|nr:toprim domain-containing protein [Ruminococcus sp.]